MGVAKLQAHGKGREIVLCAVTLLKSKRLFCFVLFPVAENHRIVQEGRGLQRSFSPAFCSGQENQLVCQTGREGRDFQESSSPAPLQWAGKTR